MLPTQPQEGPEIVQFLWKRWETVDQFAHLHAASSSYGTKSGRRSDKACMSLFSSATQLMELSLRNCRAAFRSAGVALPDVIRSRKWAASAPWSEARVSSVALWLNYWAPF